MIYDSNLLYFYTFDNNDLSGNYLKNIATNQYDLLIDTEVTIDGTLNIPSTSDTIGASITSNYTLNSSSITIGLWFKPILPFNSFSRIFSLIPIFLYVVILPLLLMVIPPLSFAKSCTYNGCSFGLE